MRVAGDLRVVACECGKLRVAVPKNVRVALVCPSCPPPKHER